MYDGCKKIIFKFQLKEFIQYINMLLEFHNILI